MKSKNLFSLNLNFLDNKHLDLKVVNINVYNEDEEEWYELKNDAMVAYENVVIKIIDQITKKEFYTFLYNTNIIVENNNVIINSNNHKNLYKKCLKKNTNSKEELKKINNEINYLEAMQVIGLDLEQFVKLQELQQVKYQQKIISKFNLCSEVEDEKEI